MNEQTGLIYFRPVATEVNLALRLLPIAVTAATITIDRPPAMIAYSIEVAAVSSLRKRHSGISGGLVEVVIAQTDTGLLPGIITARNKICVVVLATIRRKF